MAHPTGVEQSLAFFAVVHAPRRPHATLWHSLETLRTMTILASQSGEKSPPR
jgi:hypothetical protein